jgi:hypothetical protein
MRIKASAGFDIDNIRNSPIACRLADGVARRIDFHLNQFFCLL